MVTLSTAKGIDGRANVNGFGIGQVVNGNVCGTFIIVGFRTIGGEDYAQLKSFDVQTKRAERGELALPLTAIAPRDAFDSRFETVFPHPTALIAIG